MEGFEGGRWRGGGAGGGIGVESLKVEGEGGGV